MTWDDLYTSVKTDWCNRLDISTDDAGLDIIIISKVIASGLYILVKIIDGIANNIWVGSMQASKLLEVGQDKIGRGLYEAVQGEYLCSTTAKSEGTIPSGTIFLKEIDGTTYSFETTSEVTAGESVTIRALTAGTDCALVVTDTLKSQKSLTYAENTITVTSITETPTDEETIEEYREVVVSYERMRLGNGNASDYIVWVANVSGMRTAYPYTAPDEAGKAVIYCESSDSTTLVPDSSLIADCIDSIKYDSDGLSQPPVEFFEFINTTYVLPVKITLVKLSITNGDEDQLTSIQSLVRAYLLIKRPFLHTVNKYIETSDGYNTYENTIALVDIIQLLANASITFDSIVMYVDVLSAGSYVSKSKYVVGYRGGDTYPTTLSPSNDPALPAYYGECPLLDTIEFV